VVATAPTLAPPEIETDIAALTVSAKAAVSLGLIVNELTTNAVKHAFPIEHDPVIGLRGELSGDSYTMTLRHNGSPMPESIDFDDPATLGLGLQLLTTLVAELNGAIGHQREEGLTVFSITVPV